MFAALLVNDYGVFDGLVKAVVPALSEVGMAHLQLVAGFEGPRNWL